MDSELSRMAEDGRTTRKGRIMGRLFGGKDNRKAVDGAAGLESFLHSSADKLDILHAPLPPPPPPPSVIPKLAKLDTSISRYPQALAVNQLAQSNRPIAPGVHEVRSPRKSPRPNRKGLVVRFADTYPEVIGEGGDESETPVMELGRSRSTKALPAPPPQDASTERERPREGLGSNHDRSQDDDDFIPKPLSRTQTGYSSIYEPENDTPKSGQSVDFAASCPKLLVPGRNASARYLEHPNRRDENRRSFIETHQAQMREAEGQAFALAARNTSKSSRGEGADRELSPANHMDTTARPAYEDFSPILMQNRPGPAEYSPVASISSPASPQLPPDSSPGNAALHFDEPARSPAPSFLAPMASLRLRPADAAGDEALGSFVTRTRHLFELFRLHAESVQPLSSCSVHQCARAGMWWFLKGRMGLETAIRDRPSSPRSQLQNELDRQQAYTNLAKGYWLFEEIIPTMAQSQQGPPDAEITAATRSMMSALRKLSQSMKRNGILPPEDTFLPQTLDKSIWLEYPPLSQDLLSILSGNWGSGLTATQQPSSALQLLDAFPLGDTTEVFNYGRVMADVYLMEQGRSAQRVYLACLLSVVRPQKQKEIVFVLASQNGSLQLTIQDGNRAGPTWKDVKWQNDGCSLDIWLPRGFQLTAKLNQADYQTVRSMFDFGAKIEVMLQARGDEQAVFRSRLRSFQYLEADPPTRVFPRDPVPLCEVALFEKTLKESGPAGPRTWHRGFRIAAVTGPRTRTVNGVHHSFPPVLPVQFGFFRTEGGEAALSVRYEHGRHRGRMVLVFNTEKERIRFHSLLAGTALEHGEKVFADVAIRGFQVSQSMREPLGIAAVSRMPWTGARVVNDEYSEDGGDQPPTVLADRLKVVLDYQNGSVADRVNVAPGELRMRLEVSNAKVLRILRQPQQDATVSVSEAQAAKELPRKLADALQLLRANQTIRTYEFHKLRDLHGFQAALTGFEVAFDALAVTVAISRRRMVVPIHKKWESGYARIQVVRLEDRQAQLLAFFEDFQHGHCMNFVLKGTDVYESFHRGGKSGVKFVDAKFPLPRLPSEKDGDYDDMAFVCLDLPDLPGEHDDISILFDREEDRERLIACLPAPVKGSSRLSSRMKYGE